jgi:hypothetical protein
MDAASSQNLLLIHGYLALIAFIFILPLSIIVIALGRRWDLWLIAHIGLVIVATLTGIVSIAFGIVGSQYGGHLITAHQKVGVALCVAYALVVLDGIYISFTWDNHQTRTPTRDRIHWALGRILVVLSFAVCFHGYVTAEWGLWVYMVTVVFWFLWLLLYGILCIIECTTREGDQSPSQQPD